MKKELLRFTLYAIIAYLTGFALNLAFAVSQPSAENGTHFCGVSHYQSRWYRDSKQQDNRNYARRFAANLNVGGPRTVRLIYFLPNDRPYRAEVVQKMKDDILKIQTFFAEQMEAHGYGKLTFRVETDAQGKPIVHRVNARHPDSHYLDTTEEIVIGEIEQTFNFHTTNHYLVVVDNSINALGGEYGGQIGGEAGGVEDKAWGYEIVDGGYNWRVAAHELGHAFGLWHDFRDDAYLMSWGPGQNRLSACHAAFLAVHPYFNPNIPVEEGPRPTIELISPHTYPVGSQSIPVRLKISDSGGLHWVILFIGGDATKAPEVKACHGLAGKKEAVIEFDYDGVIPSNGSTNLSSPLVHPIRVEAIDTDGDVGRADFVLFSETLQPLSKISGDNQHGLPNTRLPVPFVVEARDLNNGFVRNGVPVTFTVTAGGGMLSTTRTTTDRNGRAESTLTLGPNLGTNTVEVSAGGIGQTVSFNAVADVPVDIPDPNLRAAIETTLGKAPGTPIAPAEMAALTLFEAENADIRDLTGLELATNLTRLNLGGEFVGSEYVNSNTISDLSPLAGLTNLTSLNFWGNNISGISVLAGLTNLTSLYLGFNNISDISLVANLTSLIDLGLEGNNISDISAVAGLTNLNWLNLGANSILDVSVVADLANLTWLNLGSNSISDLSALAGLTQLKTLYLWHNSISDLSPLVANTGLGQGDTVDVRGNPLSYLSIHTHIPALRSRGVTVEFDEAVHITEVPIETDPVDIPDSNFRAAIETTLGKGSGATITTVDMAKLTNLEVPSANITDLTGLEHATHLTYLTLGENSISDISVVAGLTHLDGLFLSQNNISDLSPVEGLTDLTFLLLRGNSISDISPVAGLTNLVALDLRDNRITDISALVANMGLGKGDYVDVSENPLSNTSIHTHIPTLQSRGVEVHFENLKPTTLEYLWSIPAGISLIHVPLKVTTVDGVAKRIESIADLYDTLGGADTVNFLITYASYTQKWLSYFGASETGTAADRGLTDDMGIIAGMTAPATIRLSGNPLETNGSSTITLNQGLNLVGLPLRDSRIDRVSDLFALDGIGGNVPVIILTDNGEFKAVGRADDPGDIEITGGQSFILTAQRAATVGISGDGWTNVSGTAASPPVVLTGIKVGNTTPVLALRGSIVDEGIGVNKAGFRVTVKNLSTPVKNRESTTHRAIAAMTGDAGIGYQLTIVDIETGRAAQIGDILEISAQSPDPFIGVEPLRYTVTAEDVRQSRIQLPALIAYEIPAETELLHNYPNPFNPETWIPYRLAEDAFVTLTIYDGAGQVVRTLDVGHQIAAVYENRSKAIYWDGRNGLGEQVASGVYFYHLSAGDYSATRKMVILK